jgi:DNA-binding NtrC family response regulator
MTDKSHPSGEKVWLAPALPRSVRPLLAGLGIELLAPGNRERATIRVESRAADGRAGLLVERLRIDRMGGDTYATPATPEISDTHETNVAIEFEGPDVWAAASYVVSQAFGLSPLLLTADAAMFVVIRAATRAGQVDSPILVTGETGTGKELLVRLIDAASGRSGGMALVNCAALNDSARFSESALKDPYGDTARGAATETRLAELCASSDTTLFLDQVSELSLASQRRLLHAIVRAGEGLAGERRAGARLVSVTNRPLGPMVSSGQFKRELYERLAVLTLKVPPLRERRADIGLLATGFLHSAAPRLSFTPGAFKLLGSYPFPGNVRELRNLVTRLAIMPRAGANQLIDAADLRPQLLGQSINTAVRKSSPFGMRHEMVMQALMACGGDGEAAARKLGLSVRALRQHVISSAGPAPPRHR